MKFFPLSSALIFSTLLTFTACLSESQAPETTTTKATTEEVGQVDPTPTPTNVSTPLNETSTSPEAAPIATPSVKKTPPVTKQAVVPTAPATEQTTVSTTNETPAKTPLTVTESAPETLQDAPAAPPLQTKPDHSNWDQLLQSNVSSTGKVNYEGLKNQLEKLDGYLEELSSYPPASDWSNAEKMAFWINAYNAFTVKLILNNYPVSSITDLHGGKPWDVKWIKLGDKTYSLNNIENDILRPQYKDARIHFAVNCAAKSCPPLYNRAFTASNLKSTLDLQAKKFINNPQFNSISEKEIKVSKIFDWYAIDFGDLPTYLNKYSTTTIQKDASVAFMEYNWNLNK